MKVYALFPTALKDHCNYIFPKWRSKGYSLGLYVDPGCDHPCDLLIRGAYPGVWNAWNALARAAVASGADVCVLAGDDMLCDPQKTAEEIGSEYLDRWPDGFGVMQPCGDPQGSDESGRSAAARICGSPWVGKEWIKRAYLGNGPVNGKYGAFYADEELKYIAERSGRLWMRQDLIQFHMHWSFSGGLTKQPYHERNSNLHWKNDKSIFEFQKANGFPDGAFL